MPITKLTLSTVLIALSLGVAVAEKKLALKDLPEAVQKTVQTELKGGAIRNITKETEGGIAQYEIETMLNGKHRDFNVDTKGKLLVMEEETSIDSIPAAAKTAILKKVGNGKVGMVELFTRGGETMYEAGYIKGRQKARGAREGSRNRGQGLSANLHPPARLRRSTHRPPQWRSHRSHSRPRRRASVCSPRLTHSPSPIE